MPQLPDSAPMHARSLRILYLRQQLMAETDRDHGLSLELLQNYLEGMGIPAERKTVYSDIEALQSFGDDILLHRGKIFDYRVLTRDFEDAEISLLVNAVESCKFITRDKSLQLINKLGNLTSSFRARNLRRNTQLDGRVKSQNENIYDTVNALYDSLNTGEMFTFRYFRYGRSKEQIFGHGGLKYRVYPLGVQFSDNNYYLIAYSLADGEIRNYRADRMSDAKSTHFLKKDVIPDEYRSFDIEEYSREMFSMFGGEPAEVTMQFHESLASQVIDRFGSELVFIPEGKEDFKVKTRVVPSPNFFSWIASFSGRAKILNPPGVVSDYREMLSAALEASNK